MIATKYFVLLVALAFVLTGVESRRKCKSIVEPCPKKGINLDWGSCKKQCPASPICLSGELKRNGEQCCCEQERADSNGSNGSHEKGKDSKEKGKDSKEKDKDSKEKGNGSNGSH